jgi:ADP-ribosylglycohydrolase
MKSVASDLEDAALGCFLGAAVGDAAGGTLEFEEHPAPEDVERAMAMTGGGPHGLAPGQITDDGELALSLADALSRSREFDVEAVARAYARWIDSDPFDVGTTTRASLAGFRAVQEQEPYAPRMKAAARTSMGSKANGGLMRIAPLALWGRRLPDPELAACAMEDSRLSHPNPSCCHSAAAYVIAIASLLRAASDRRGAFERARAWAEAHANDEVRSWLREAEESAPVDFHTHAGFVKVAFVNAFEHLLRGADYPDTLRETLRAGGDTDTNACIAGALVGAATGAGGIPEPMWRAVVECDTSRGRPRPEPFHGRRIPELARDLLNAAR